MCLFLKSDIIEYSHSLDLPAHNDGIAPCPLCFPTPEDFTFECDGLSPTGGGLLPERTLQTYVRACRECEVTVATTRELVEQMRHALYYDKSKQGPCGRAVVSDNFEHLGVLRRDRLEPSRGFPHVGDFEFRQPPFLVTFWRRRAETATRHKNPIFGPATGLGPRKIGLDWLHILSLGIIQILLMNLIWDLVTSNVFGFDGSAQNVFELTIHRLKGHLTRWYNSEATEGRLHTRVQQPIPTMFGTNSARKFALHGAETNGFLKFCFAALRRWTGLGPKQQHYFDGCGALVTIVDLIREHPRVMEPPIAMAFVNAVAALFRASEVLEIQHVPKHHFLAEMARRLSWKNDVHITVCTHDVECKH
jgi:hypothetical protein